MGERRRIATLGLLLVCGTALLAAGGKSEAPSPKAI